jgi:FKBP-type peptidyl-prolyl cis-trans isomerase SlyD
MQISKNAVVAFHYSLFNEAGEEVENSHNGDPTLCLIGANNIMQGLEDELMGKQAGDKVEVTLPPLQAYGLYQETKKDRISAKYLKHEKKLQPGKIVTINTDKGSKPATVIKVGKFTVDIDLNHPLAGQTIHFKVTIQEVREATNEEKAHGHAHGAGGHNH